MMVFEIVRTIKSKDGKRKVDIFRRENGTFGFSDMEFGEDEGFWFPAGKYSTAIFNSEETALKEVQSRVIWLAREIGETERHGL